MAPKKKNAPSPAPAKPAAATAAANDDIPPIDPGAPKQMPAEPTYRPLDPSRIFANVLPRNVYLGVMQFIANELQGLDLVGRKAAVTEGIQCCVEQGLTDQQVTVFMGGFAGWSYDRLCTILTNLLTEAGEEWRTGGPYVDMVKFAFKVVKPVQREESKSRETDQLEREVRMLREKNNQLERGGGGEQEPKRGPGRPKGKTTAAAPATATAPAPAAKKTVKPVKTAARRCNDEDDDDDDEDDDYNDDVDDYDDPRDCEYDDFVSSASTRHTKASKASSQKYPVQQPSILLDGRKWHHLNDQSWTDIKRAFEGQYSSAHGKFTHDFGFMTDVLGYVHQTMQLVMEELPDQYSEDVPFPIAKLVDRIVSRCEYYQAKALCTSEKDKSKAPELEARLIERDLPRHVQRARKAVKKQGN